MSTFEFGVIGIGTVARLPVAKVCTIQSLVSVNLQPTPPCAFYWIEVSSTGFLLRLGQTLRRMHV